MLPQFNFSLMDEIIQYHKTMFRVCRQAAEILLASYEETALISGISDIIVVQWDDKTFKSSPFLACFGSLTLQARQEQIKILVNGIAIEKVNFEVNKYGYLEPFYPSSQDIVKLGLFHGKNKIVFKTSRVTLEAEIYLYNLTDKIIISDLDGTMTKTDIMGIVSNYRDVNYIHDGYEIFINELCKNGYKIIWLTMRSMAMYNFSKKYINKYVKCEGALIPEPEQFLPSLKKELMKKTSNIKTNMLRKIKELYPPNVNPFSGGLGNRENDAIAYAALGIPMDRIYLVSEESQIMTLNKTLLKNYIQLKQQIESHFPPTEERKNELKSRESSTTEKQQQSRKLSKGESKLHKMLNEVSQQEEEMKQK